MVGVRDFRFRVLMLSVRVLMGMLLVFSQAATSAMPEKLRSGVVAPSSDGRLWGAWPNGDKPSGISKLLTLNSANSGNSSYHYWNPTTNYAGAFRIPLAPGGHASGTAYSEGAIAYNPDNNSFFVSGHRDYKTICEVAMPTTLGTATTIATVGTLPLASVVQQLSSFSGRGADANSGHKIAGMWYEQGKLLVTLFEHYAQDKSYKDVFFVVRNASNLSGSAVDGTMETAFDTAAGGWISPIPTEYQSSLGGTHLTGFSASGSNRSSIQALSMGPAAFSADLSSLIANSATFGTGVVTQNNLLRYQYLDYTDTQELVPTDDLYNWNGTTTLGSNPLWSALSENSYGIIVPNTRSYIVFGSMTMHGSGGWYGNNEGTGNQALPAGISPHISFENQGPHPRLWSDNRYNYWIYDVADMTAVRSGTAPDSWAVRYAAKYGATPRALLPYELVPYEWGAFPMPFDTSPDWDMFVGGGAIKSSTNQLFLTIRAKDTSQGESATPIVVGWNNFRGN